MTSTQTLHHQLLRPAIIHILRANGFASARPSVLDTLTDLAARYLELIATRTASHVHDRTLASLDDERFADSDLVLLAQEDLIPTITDMRLGLADSSFFSATMTASEEAWAEALRRPLAEYPPGAMDKERRRRDAEDTRDVRDFVDWAAGPTAREIRRVAGLLHEKPGAGDAITQAAAAAAAVVAPAPAPVAGAGAVEPLTADGFPERQDYLQVLRKKQGKHSDEARYAGTVLGRDADEGRTHRIEGGPHTIGDWSRSIKRKRSRLAT